MATCLGSFVQMREGGILQQILLACAGSARMDGPHWVCHSPRQRVLPVSTLLRLPDALQGRYPEWALHFVHVPCLSCLGSWGLHKGTDPDGLCVLFGWPVLGELTA